MNAPSSNRQVGHLPLKAHRQSDFYITQAERNFRISISDY